MLTDTLEGWRDWIVLGLLLGAVLRSEDIAALTFGVLKTQPMKRGKMREVPETNVKGDKNRVIPVKALPTWNLR